MHEILTVSELTNAIKKQLESRFAQVCIRGEISNLKEQASGHLYFTLKDAESQISAVLFKGSTRSLSRLPKNGDQVVVRGELSVYAPRGNYQVIVREVDYLGVGELLLKLHELKAKLEKMGFFSSERKKKLPKYPKVIGVVTSPTGSVIQDILNILNRRFSGFHLILNPVKVQGEGAAQEIAEAIAQFNRHKLADVLIVGRGGGSLEDLWAFNEEIVAHAIFQSEIPIVSAVGHETDFCIADFVADVRAPTPSAAAEMVIAEKAQQIKFLQQAGARLTYAVKTLAVQQRKVLDRFKKEPCLSSPYTMLGTRLQQIDDARADIDQSILQQIEKKKLHLLSFSKQAAALKPSYQLASLKQKLSSLNKGIDLVSSQQLTEKKNRLRQLVAHLKAIDPKNLLKNGYCILFQENNDSVILSTQELGDNQKARIMLHDGQAHITVNKVLI